MACDGVCKFRKVVTEVKIKELGLVDYESTYQAMMNLIATKPDYHSIWLLQHNPVFTIGISEKEIKEDKTKVPPFIKTDRGGKTTFHGPGQTVIYFILNLKKLPFSPTDLTKNILHSAAEVLSDYGLGYAINEKDPGIFIGIKKVASIGMRIKKNYCYHGLSMNLKVDLSVFNSIKPCGLDVEACNLQDYININELEFKEGFFEKFEQKIRR